MSKSGALSATSSSPTIATSFVTDAGTAIPALNILNLLGTNGATTSGTGNTVSVLMQSPFTGVFEFKHAGTSATVDNILTITNLTDTVAGGGAALLGKLQASDGNSYDAGKIAFLSDGSTWTSTAASRDSMYQISTCLNGTVSAKITTLSSGFTGFGTAVPYHQVQVLNAMKVSDTGQNAGVIGLGDGSSATINVGVGRGNATGGLGGSSWLILGGLGGIHLTSSATTVGAQTIGMTMVQGGAVGFATVVPGKQVEINHATGECLRLTYNDADGSATVYSDLTVTAGGILTLAPTAAQVSITNAAANDIITLTDSSDNIDVQLHTGSDSFFNGGDLGLGNAAPAVQLHLTGDLAITPSSTYSITAAGGITAAMLLANGIIRIDGDSGAIDITADPQIAAGVTDGQIIRFIGQHDTNTVTFDDGTGLQLAGAASAVLGSGDTLELWWDSGLSVYVEAGRSDN